MGSGLQGVIDGRRVAAGSRDMIFPGGHVSEWASRAIRRASWRSALTVFVAVEGRPIGALLLADELRADTPRAIRMMREAGVARMVMVTGDRAAAAQAIGAALDLDAVLADRVPSDKVDAVRSEQRLHPTIMVGDGINDAPALASADVGIALGARGASASSEAADVVILADRLDRVGEAIVIARRARRIAVESIVAGMGLVDARDAGRDARLADAGAGGHRSGGDRRRRDPQCTARLDPRLRPRRTAHDRRGRTRAASQPRFADRQPRPAAIDRRYARRRHAAKRRGADRGGQQGGSGAGGRARARRRRQCLSAACRDSSGRATAFPP